MSSISTPAVDAATGATAGLFARIKKTAGSVPKIIKVKGPAFLLVGAILTAASENSFAQFNRSLDRIEGGREIQTMPVPQTLGVYNGASAGAGRPRTDRTSAARRTRVPPVPRPRRQ